MNANSTAGLGELSERTDVNTDFPMCSPASPQGEKYLEKGEDGAPAFPFSYHV